MQKIIIRGESPLAKFIENSINKKRKIVEEIKMEMINNVNNKPKGIRHRGNGRYQAYFSFSFNGKSIYKVIGSFGSQEEAIKARNNFINNLK